MRGKGQSNRNLIFVTLLPNKMKEMNLIIEGAPTVRASSFSLPAAFRLFGVDPDDLKGLARVALSKGGDYADFYFEYSTSDDLMLRDGEVSSVGSHADYGVGVRVLSGEMTGYAYSEKTDIPSMTEAAQMAASIASQIREVPVPEQACALEAPENRYPVLKTWEDYPVQQQKEFLKALDAAVHQQDDRVLKVIARLAHSRSQVFFYNSEGVMHTDDRPMASLSLTCIMKQGSRVENFSASRSFRSGSEMLTEALCHELAHEVVACCARMMEAEQPTGGVMPVVMGAGGSGILLHEAMGHAFEADFNRKGTSVFSDKMGKRICPEGITVVDDATLYANRGSLNFDDEGTPGQRTVMVDDGILTSYLHDRISAKYYGVAPTGNGRRESFRYMPLPRMRATYMEAGRVAEADLIRDIKKGIYVDHFSNGQVQIGVGDFTFYVKSGYLIENGELTRPIKDTNIIGNGPRVLSDILGVADNLKIDNGTWTCGKEQYCAVSCGMPSVLIRQLNVGGSL